MEASDVLNCLSEQANEVECGTIQVSEYELADKLGSDVKQVHEALVVLRDVEKVKIIRAIDQEKRIVELALPGWRKQIKVVEKDSIDEMEILGKYLYRFTEGEKFRGQVYYMERAKTLIDLYGYSMETLKNSFLVSNKYCQLQCEKMLENANIEPKEKEFYERELERLKVTQESYLAFKRSKRG